MKSVSHRVGGTASGDDVAEANARKLNAARAAKSPPDGAEAMLRASEERYRVLADASGLLAASLDYETTLANLARFLVPRLADWCAIDLDEGGALPKLVAVAHEDPEKVSLARELREKYPPSIEDASGLMAVLRTGRSELYADVTDDLLRLGARDEEHLAIARALGMRSAMVVPLIARNRTLGAITLVSTRAGRLYTETDLRLMEETASRAALAVDNARLFRALEQQTRRLQILAQASAALSSSLDRRLALMSLARVMVSSFADGCVVCVFGIDGRADDFVVAHADPAKEATLGEVERRFCQGARARAPIKDAVARRTPVVYRDLTRDERREMATSDEHFALLESVGTRSLIVVPLIARGTILGTIAFGREVPEGYGDADVSLSAELAHRVALAVDSARLFDQTREALALRDEFLSIASHELNTPLTPLKLQVESLRRGGHKPEKVVAKLDVIARQVVRITKLVSQLLDVSRITAGRLHLELEPVDLSALTEEVVLRMHDEIARSGSIVTKTIEPKIVGQWDLMRLDQVVVNLLANAIKYGQGKPIAISVERRGDVARLTVRDEGIGIDAEHQARIFQRFDRAVSSRHYGGFGLGLWIVRQILDASRGTINVVSRAGVGSTFTVELPCNPQNERSVES